MSLRNLQTALARMPASIPNIKQQSRVKFTIDTPTVINIRPKTKTRRGTVSPYKMKTVISKSVATPGTSAKAATPATPAKKSRVVRSKQVFIFTKTAEDKWRAQFKKCAACATTSSSSIPKLMTTREVTQFAQTQMIKSRDTVDKLVAQSPDITKMLRPKPTIYELSYAAQVKPQFPNKAVRQLMPVHAIFRRIQRPNTRTVVFSGTIGIKPLHPRSR